MMTHKELTYLIEQYAQGTITAEKKAELLSFLADLGLENITDELISDWLKQDTSGNHPDAFETTIQKHLNTIFSTDKGLDYSTDYPLNPVLNEPRTHRVHFLRRWGWAAAVIILLGVATIALVVSSDRQPKSSGTGDLAASSRDIAPGRDRAILTLANGQQIVLDSTQGNIVKQGDLMVVNLEGKLKYEGLGTHAEYHTISTPKGGQYQVVLPDGSKVWLNAASSIKFPTVFTGDTRNVEMTGEAYMEITRNPRQPFVVVAKGVRIQVLGTSFNVNAYQNETAVRTTLISGSVKVMSGVNQSVGNESDRISSSGVVSSDPPLNTVVLKPGQQAVVADHNADHVKVQTADIEQALDWKNGIFNFNGADLETVMRQLERWYVIEVRYQGAVPNLVFKGKMYRNVNFSDVLDMLTRMGVRYELEGKTLIVL